MRFVLFICVPCHHYLVSVVSSNSFVHFVPYLSNISSIAETCSSVKASTASQLITFSQSISLPLQTATHESLRLSFLQCRPSPLLSFRYKTIIHLTTDTKRIRLVLVWLVKHKGFILVVHESL
jgi:hypothetical protein